MAEREYEYGKLIPVPEDQQEYIFDPEIRELLATGDAIQAYPASMESDRVGLPTALARGAADLFDTSRREVVLPAETQLGAATEFFNPVTNEFESRADETIRPGVFMRPEEGRGPQARENMPLARGFSQAVDFAGDLMTSPETRAETARALQEFPDIFARQMKISGEAGLRGERVIDPETGMKGSPFDPLLAATAGLGVARAAGGIPNDGPALGIFGGKLAKNKRQNFEDFEQLTRDKKFPLALATERTKVFVGTDNNLKTPLGFLRVADADGNYKSGSFQSLRLAFFSKNEDGDKEAPLIDVAPVQAQQGMFSNESIYEAYPELKDLVVRINTAESPDDRPRYDENLQRLLLPSARAEELQVAVQDYIGKKEGFARPIDPEIYRASIKQNLLTLPLSGGTATDLKRFSGFNDPLGTQTRQEIVEMPEDRSLSFNPLDYSGIDDSFNNLDLPVPGEILPRIGAEAALGSKTVQVLDPQKQGYKAEPLSFHLTGPEAMGIISDSVSSYENFPVIGLSAQNLFFRDNPKLQADAAALNEQYENTSGNGYVDQTIRLVQERLRRKNKFKGKTAKQLAQMAEKGTFGKAYAANIKNLQEELAKLMPPSDPLDSGPFSRILGLFRRQEKNIDTSDDADERSKILAQLAVGANYYENLSTEDQKRLVSGGPDRYLSRGILTLQDEIIDPGAIDDLFLDYGSSMAGIPSMLDKRERLLQEREDLSIPAPVNPVFDKIRDTAGAELPIFTNFNKPLPKVKRLLGNLPRTRGTPEQFIADLKKAGATPADLSNLNLERYFKESATDGKLNRDAALLAFDLADRPLEYGVDQRNTYRGVSLPIDDDGSLETITVHSPIRAGDERFFNEQHSFASPVKNKNGENAPDAFLLVDDVSAPPTKPNLLGHVRNTEHVDPSTGEKTYLMNELQSNFAKALLKLPQTIEIAASRRATKENISTEEAKEQVRAELYASPFSSEKPEKFFRRIQQQLLERSLRRAVELDADHFGTVTGDMSGLIQNSSRDYKPQYNAKMVADLKKLAKKYGLEFAPALGGKSLPVLITRDGGRSKYEQIDEALNEERDESFDFNAMESDEVDDAMYITVNSLKLTPEAKERILAEPFEFSKGGAVQSYYNGGMVNNMKPRVTRGLTNLLNKYNTSGPLAGAGNVPRGTIPVQMNRGGDPEFGGRSDYSQFDRGDYVRSQTPGMGPAMMNPGFTLGDMQANILAAAAAAQTTQAEPAPPPVVSAPPPAQQQTAPFTPSTGIVAGGPAPGEYDVEVIRDDGGVIVGGRTQIPQPDPLPPPPPPPVMETPPVVDVVQPPSAPVTPPPMLPPAPDLPPPVYTPPPPTEVTVPTEPMFTPPPIADTPDLSTPGMLSDAVVDFDISDEITPQTEGYATTRGMNIAATGDPFGDAVEGEYQMPIYKPQVSAGAMPFLSVRYGRPTASDTPPEPPRSDQYSTGSFGRANYAEALANWERLYGPVEEYQAPDTEAVMDDTSSASALTGTSTSSGTNFYPEPPPVRGGGSIGATTRYMAEKLKWEQKYGPVEDYYAAQEAAQNDFINVYLSRQGEEAVANSMGYDVEQLRLINEDRRKQGLPPLGALNQFSDINVNPGGM